MDYYNQVEYGDTDGSRQWLYQTCTEFGWYQTSDQPEHPYSSKFPIDVKLEVIRTKNYSIYISFENGIKKEH